MKVLLLDSVQRYSDRSEDMVPTAIDLSITMPVGKQRFYSPATKPRPAGGLSRRLHLAFILRGRERLLPSPQLRGRHATGYSENQQQNEPSQHGNYANWGGVDSGVPVRVLLQRNSVCKYSGPGTGGHLECQMEIDVAWWVHLRMLELWRSFCCEL